MARTHKPLEIGQRFGRWTVLERLPKHNGKPSLMYLCRCDCGTERAVYSSQLRCGTSMGCGSPRHRTADLEHHRETLRLLRQALFVDRVAAKKILREREPWLFESDAEAR